MTGTTHRIIVAGASLLLTGALAACTAQTSGPSTAPSTPAAASEPAASASPTPSAAPAPAHGGAPQGARDGAALSEKKQSGRAVKLQHNDDGTWTIDVVKSGSNAVDSVKVSGDGAQVTGAAKAPDLSGDTLTQFTQARANVSDAVAAAIQEVPGGVDSVTLTSHKNAPAYDVTMFAGGGTDQRHVYVNAVNGSFMETA
ncbi:PepSY domain-containing protein [Nigerium massiliense]|uniref:PepSY domain-containing protein n=1 Tax=Nigerium massiliense TaxID=1522317 RepID=UPI0005913CB3|nr:PepSY domain-containing protein [Nigerium massiliense]